MLYQSITFHWNNVISASNAIHPAFTCTRLTKETLEKGVKYVGVFIVNFEHVIAGGDGNDEY